VTLRPGDLVLCAGTLGRACFRERAQAAAKAGFRGISVFASDLEGARTEGLAPSDLRAFLADQGLAVAEVDPLLRWLPGTELAGDATEEGAAFHAYSEDDLFAVAEAAGARSLNAVAYADRPLPRDAVAEAFAGLCDRARERDLLVHLEFLPWTQVSDAFAALEIAEAAGRPNGGVMLDTWHHFRSGIPDARLRELPGARILGVQLSDAPAAPEADPVDETLHRRLLPGEGAIDLRGIAAILEEIGAPAPFGVEVFSDVLAALPPLEAARRAGEAARSALGR
jgi:sugar phosphate isomerase/epimerase